MFMMFCYKKALLYLLMIMCVDGFPSVLIAVLLFSEVLDLSCVAPRYYCCVCVCVCAAVMLRLRVRCCFALCFVVFGFVLLLLFFRVIKLFKCV